MRNATARSCQDVLLQETDVSDPSVFVRGGTTTPRRTPSLAPASRQGRPSSWPRWGGSPCPRGPPAGHSLVATPHNGSLPSLGLEARRVSDVERRVAQTATQQREQNCPWLEETRRSAQSHLSAAAAWRPFARGMLPPAGRMRGRSRAAAWTGRATCEGQLSGQPQSHHHAWRTGGGKRGEGETWASEAPSSNSVPNTL